MPRSEASSRWRAGAGGGGAEEGRREEGVFPFMNSLSRRGQSVIHPQRRRQQLARRMERRTPRFSRDAGGRGQDARLQDALRAIDYQPDAMHRATLATSVVKSPRSYSAMRSTLPRFRESGLRATDPELADALCKIECAPAS